MAEEPQNNNAYWAANLRIILISLVLSRIRAAPSARLGHLTFECQGAFPSQC